MQTFTTSALLLSALSAPALAVAQYGDSSGSSSTSSMMAATTVASSSSPTHTVQVGANGLAFTPNSVTAAKGDTLEFHFSGSTHDVVSGSFSSPCSDNNGVNSGYPGSSDVFQVMVNSTDPMWMFCSTPGHCQGGMAMVVNQAST